MSARPRSAAAALRSVPLFNALSQEQLTSMARTARSRDVAADTFLFQEGEHCRGLWVVTRGVFKIVRVSYEGRELIYYLARRHTPLTEAPLLSGEPHFTSAAALGDSSALLVETRALQELIAQEPTFAETLMEHQARRLREHMSNMGDLVLKRLPSRLAGFLRGFADRSGASEGTPCVLDRTLSLEIVSGLLQATREEVSRTLRVLSDEGVIAYNRKRITILDLQALAQRAQEAGTGE